MSSHGSVFRGLGKVFHVVRRLAALDVRDLGAGLGQFIGFREVLERGAQNHVHQFVLPIIHPNTMVVRSTFALS